MDIDYRSFTGRENPQLLPVHVENSVYHGMDALFARRLCGRGLAPLALLSSRNLRPGLSARTLDRVSMCGKLLVKIAAAEVASLGHEDHVVDELLLELDLIVQSGFQVLDRVLDAFHLEESGDNGRIGFAV